jgi:hypothetical protein
MSYPEPLDYFSYHSQQMLSFEGWPTPIFPPWDTTAFPELGPAMCESDPLQAPDLFAQTIHSNAEPGFDQSAILPTEATETQGLTSESSPTRPEYVAMARETLSPRSPSLPKGRATRPAKSNSVSLRDGISKASRRERNKESTAKHRGDLFEMIGEAWDLLPDDEKKGLDGKRRLPKLKKAIGYFREQT